MATLLSLPTEILCHIANHSDSRALASMRLACKQLKDASSKPFGLTFMRRRHHVLSESSIRSLLAIVTHREFGHYVTSIVITAMYPLHMTYSGSGRQYHQDSRGYRVPGLAIGNAFVNSTEYMRLMKQAFNEIRKQGNRVEICIRNHLSGVGYGWDDMVNNPSVMFDHCYAEALSRTLIATIRADCPVRSLVLSMNHYDFPNLVDALEDLLSPTRMPLQLTIYCTRRRLSRLQCPYTCIYDQEKGTLELKGCDLYEFKHAKPGSTIKQTLAYLLSQGTSHLILEDCHLCPGSQFRELLSLGSGSLTSVTLRQFRPCRSGIVAARAHWPVIMSALSQHTGLKHFVIEGLAQPSDWALFHLPANTEKYEALGEDVSDQLRSMAALVATATE